MVGERKIGLEPDATTCGVGECVAPGERVCQDGAWADACVPGEPQDEVCDGLDNDCDG